MGRVGRWLLVCDEVLDQHQIAAGVIALSKYQIALIWRQAESYPELLVRYHDGTAVPCGKTQEPNQLPCRILRDLETVN